MEIEILNLLFDSGLLVLIWMIQLIVYPSFLYYNKEALVSWHRKYTLRLAIIVIPLMFGQLLLTSWQWYQLQTLEMTMRLLLVIAVWVSTFVQFVPIHNKITQGKATNQHLKQLVHRNWLRTTLWTLICILGIFLVITK
tara:strand:+ start:11732 stop:12148 length:417 start_codon:yes stop_codon:yes gene_type:complete